MTMTLMHHTPPRETTCYRTAPRSAIGPVHVRSNKELHDARTRQPASEPIDPILLGVLIVLATVAAGLLLGGLWTLAAAHPTAIDAPYFVT
jgi:hypothetical protein